MGEVGQGDVFDWGLVAILQDGLSDFRGVLLIVRLLFEVTIEELAQLEAGLFYGPQVEPFLLGIPLDPLVLAIDLHVGPNRAHSVHYGEVGPGDESCAFDLL
jgi:hypothetical protein